MERNNNYNILLTVSDYEATQMRIGCDKVKEDIVNRVIQALNERDSEPDDFYTAYALRHTKKEVKQKQLDLK